MNGQSVKVTLTAASAGAGSYAYAAGEAEGKYTARIEGEPDSENYTIAGGGTLTIAPRELTLVWSGYENLVYDGMEKNVRAVADGLLPGDMCTVTVEDGNEINAGRYTARVVDWDNKNYVLPEEPTRDYTIDPAPLTIPDQKFTYNGSNALQVPLDNANGAVNGETVTVILLAYSADAGVYTFSESVAEGKYTTLLQDENYTVVGGGTLTIEKAASTVTPSTEETIPYGDPLVLTAKVDIAPMALINQVEFFVNDGAEPVGFAPVVNGQATLSNVRASRANGFDLGDNTIKAVYGGSVNLNDSESDTITVKVTQKELKVSVTGTNSKEYDGTTAAPGDVRIVLEGVVEGDDVTAEAKSFAYDHETVKDASRITAADITLSGEHAKYYKLPDTSAYMDAEITPAASTVIPPEAKQGLKENGKAQELVTEGSATGGELQYALSKDGPWSASVPTGKKAGTYTVWYRVVGDDNHSDIAPQSVKVKIAQKKSDDPDNTQKPAQTVPHTGDESNIALWAALLGLSAAALCGVTAILHRKKRNNL